MQVLFNEFLMTNVEVLYEKLLKFLEWHIVVETGHKFLKPPGFLLVIFRRVFEVDEADDGKSSLLCCFLRSHYAMINCFQLIA